MNNNLTTTNQNSKLALARSKKLLDITKKLSDSKKEMTRGFQSTPLNKEKGHSAPVISIAISPDGNFIVSGSWDGTIKVWDIQSGECLNTFKGHSDAVISIAIIPDGNFIVSGSWDGTIKIWDIQSRECLNTLEGHSDIVMSIAISPDGKSIISGSGDKTIKVWDMQSGECLNTLKAHSDAVRSIAISPDGNSIVSGSWDGTIKVWDIENRECINTLTGHSVAISIAISPDGKSIISGSRDKTIRVWDMYSGECLNTLVGHSDTIYSIAISPDGKSIISGSGDKTIKVWDMQSGECLNTLVGHSDTIYSVAITPDGNSIVSGSRDITIEVWDMHSGELLDIINNNYKSYKVENEIDCDCGIAISPDDKYLYFSSKHNDLYTITVWNIHQRVIYKTFEKIEGPIYYLEITPDGKILISGAYNEIKIWNIQSGECIKTIPREDFIRSLKISQDGNKFIVADENNIALCNIHSGEVIKNLDIENANNIIWIEDNIIAYSAWGKIYIWDIKKNICIRSWEANQWRINSLSLSTNEKYIISGSDDRIVKVWDFYGYQISNFDEDCYYATNDTNIKEIKLYKIYDVNKPRIMDGNNRGVNSVISVPNHKYILSGNGNSTINVLDLETSTCVKRYVGFPAYIETMKITSCGKYLIAVSCFDIRVIDLLEDREVYSIKYR